LKFLIPAIPRDFQILVESGSGKIIFLKIIFKGVGVAFLNGFVELVKLGYS